VAIGGEAALSPDVEGYVVVDGNIRLDAAIKTGQAAVPYFFSPDTADAEGIQYLHMLITSRFRRALTIHEEAAALFSAAEAGLTRTQIRKTTGLKAEEVRAGITAGGLSPTARDIARQADYEWDLEELALLSQFQDEPDTMERIMREIGYGSNLRYIVQRITDEREAAARREKTLEELRASGVTVVDSFPADAVALIHLVTDDAAADSENPDSENPGSSEQDAGDPADAGDDSRELTPEDHASCPGAAAVLYSYRDDPVHLCLNPGQYGHRSRYARTGSVSPTAGTASGGAPGDQPGTKPGGTERAIVIEGNKA
jgi:ParB family transcriptional regulator, chromosome partitioning protein